MTAGRGISHSEVSTPGTTTLHGAQLWVALPDAARDGEPGFEHYAPPAVDAAQGWAARVFLGSLLGSTSPVSTSRPAARRGDRARGRVPRSTSTSTPAYEHGRARRHRACVRRSTADRGQGARARVRRARRRTADPRRSATTSARLLLLGGEPFGEPIVMWWNFVGRTHEEIVAFRERWQAQMLDDGGAAGIRLRRAGSTSRPSPSEWFATARRCAPDGSGWCSASTCRRSPRPRCRTPGSRSSVALGSEAVGEDSRAHERLGLLRPQGHVRQLHPQAEPGAQPHPGAGRRQRRRSCASTASRSSEIRLVDHDVATGVYPDMREHGWETDAWPDLYPGHPRQRHPGRRRPDLARRQLQRHQAAHRADLRAERRAQRQGPVPLLRPGRRVPDHRQRGRHQALRAERPLQPPARRLHDPAERRRRLDRRGRPGSVVPRPRQRRPRERLHQPQHHVHDLEPHAPGEDAQGRRRACPATATSGRSGTPARGSTSRTRSTGRSGRSCRRGGRRRALPVGGRHPRSHARTTTTPSGATGSTARRRTSND